MTHSVQTALHALLDANQHFSPHGKDTALHCPMALMALAGMGATAADLLRFHRHWVTTQARPLEPSGSAIVWADWPQQVGEGSAFAALRQCFLEQIAAIGPEAVVAAVMTALPFSPATGAFHPVIRLAAGLVAGHHAEVASGLAAYVSGYFAPGVTMQGRTASESFHAALQRLGDGFGGSRFAGEWITERLAAVAADPRLEGCLQGPPANVADLQPVRHLALDLYLSTGDFAAMHGVTGLHAVAIVQEHIPALTIEQVLPGSWLALVLLTVMLGVPELKELATSNEPTNWPALLSEAITRNDDHGIKLTWTCHQSWLRDPDLRYWQAAVRRLGGFSLQI